jgi:hypothetical protein
LEQLAQLRRLQILLAKLQRKQNVVYDKKMIMAFLKKAEEENRFTDKEHRQHEHIMRSEEEAGKSKEEADKIGWATVNKEATKNAPKNSPECGAVCQMRHNGMTEEEAMSHWNKEKKADKVLRDYLHKKSNTSIVDRLVAKAYSANPGGSGMNGGNFSMGPSMNVGTGTSVSTPTDSSHASDPTFQYKTRGKGQVKDVKRYTGPEQRVVQKPDSNVKMKTKYDKTPLDQDSLKRLYPSLFQEKPSTVQTFKNWLRGLHTQFFGGASGNEPEIAQPQGGDPYADFAAGKTNQHPDLQMAAAREIQDVD